jgi:N utilization substance protein B
MARAEKRSAARLGAVQALYQMDVSAASIADVFSQFETFWLGKEVEGDEYKPAETAFFRSIVEGVLREQRILDPDIDAALAKGWPLKRIETVLRAILRAGAFELLHRKDVPARVVITEYVDVAHAFLDKDESGMVNAVLDSLARKLRIDELDNKAEKSEAG